MKTMAILHNDKNNHNFYRNTKLNTKLGALTIQFFALYKKKKKKKPKQIVKKCSPSLSLCV